MNRKQHSVILASLLALALAGCSSMKGSSDTGAGATGSGIGTSSSGSMGSGSSAMPAASEGASTGGAGMAGTASPQAGQMPPPSAGGSMAAPQGAPNAVVTVIEVIPRPADGSAAVGGSGTAGATGSSAGAEKMYRITLRMDDGSTRIVTQDRAPTFRNGDRVNMTDGMITQ